MFPSHDLVGDGLEALDADGLKSIVDNINKRVEKGTGTKEEYNRKRCRTSKVNDKQRGFIRSWRRNFGQQFPEN